MRLLIGAIRSSSIDKCGLCSLPTDSYFDFGKVSLVGGFVINQIKRRRRLFYGSSCKTELSSLKLELVFHKSATVVVEINWRTHWQTRGTNPQLCRTLSVPSY